jgi:DNA-directed RNA polymerase subunit alpha
MLVRGVHHEFSTIPHIREDMTSLLLNLKQIRFRFFDDEEETARLRLEVRGEGVVTAGDIVCPPTIEVVNPEAYILTTDSVEADVEMEMTVGRGRGYSPAEERDTLAVSEIPTDAIFGPVRKANFKVERTRVGQVSNFDRLIMEVWTDGTIQPVEALSTSAQLLVKHLALVAEFGDITVEVEPEVEEKRIPDRVAETDIEELELSVRAFNCLKRAGITKVGEILEKLERGDDELLAIRNFGVKSLAQLKQRLEAKEFWPLPEEEE